MNMQIVFRVFLSDTDVTILIRNGAKSNEITTAVIGLLSPETMRAFVDGEDLILLFPATTTSLSEIIKELSQKTATLLTPTNVNGLLPLTAEKECSAPRYEAYKEILPKSEVVPEVSKPVVLNTINGMQPNDVLKAFGQKGFWMIIKALRDDNLTPELRADAKRIVKTYALSHRLGAGTVGHFSRAELQGILQDGADAVGENCITLITTKGKTLSDFLSEKDVCLRIAVRQLLQYAYTFL